MDAARLRPHHSRSNSQATENTPGYQSSDDGYDYNVVDDAPEAQPTKPKDLSLSNFRRHTTEVTVLRRPEVTDNAFTETMPHIFQRQSGGRRAKIPTDVEVDLEKGTNGSTTSKEKEPKAAIPKLTNVKLRWTMPEINGSRMLKLNHDKADLGVQKPYLQSRRVRWW